MKTETATALPPGTSLNDALDQQAARAPDERAIIDDRAAITWAGLRGQVMRCTAALESLGLQPGERIGLHALNSIELAVTILACWRAGLVTLMLTPASKGPEVAQELSASGAAAYLGDPDLYPVGEAVLGRCPQLRLALLLKHGAFAPEVVARFPNRMSTEVEPPTRPPGLAAILFSSGTTGIPKGVMYTHAALAAMGQPDLDFPVTIWQPVLAVAPLGYISSLMALARCLVNGGTMVLLRGFNTGLLLDAVAAHQCKSVFVLPASACWAVLEAQRAQRRDTGSCRLWGVGGDVVPTNLFRAWKEHFGHAILQGYGLTECFPALTNPPDRNRPGSMGLAWPGLEIRLSGDAGTECGPGEAGEIQLRAPWLFAGYWNDPETTARLMPDGWFRTGDLAHRDADGYYWFRVRIKQIITCDGEKISPQHVEGALMEHPEVAEAAVVGRPDELHGEVPVAFARLRPGATVDAAALREFVRVRVEDRGVPAEIRFVEALPHGRTGKVDRRALREKAITLASAEPSR